MIIIAHVIMNYMEENALEDRMILIDKPAGITSFGVVAKVRGVLRARFGHKIKVGHTGTLDPFATGLLILLSGKMTKKSSEFLKLDKWYEATMRLGFVSSTGDIEGQIQPYSARDVLLAPVATRLAHYSSPCQAPGSLRLNIIESVLDNFVGRILQTPPRYSAIKVNGRRAYMLARNGVEFEIPKREVEVYSIDVLRYEWPELVIRCHVSSGTYVRTLAEDIGEMLGVGAYLTALRRLKVGKYDVKDALKLEDFDGMNQ